MVDKKNDSILVKWKSAVLLFFLCFVGFLSYQIALSKASSIASEAQNQTDKESIVDLSIPTASKNLVALNWNCVGPEVAVLRTKLALMPESDVSNRETIEGEIEAWETLIAICETVTPPAGIPEDLLQFTRETVPPFETGIFEGQPGAYFHGFEAKIENHWKGIMDGKYVFVFAGAWVDDPDQGFIKVQITPKRGNPVWSYFPSPQKSGALRIIDAKGTRLVIQSANDKNILYFDIPALTYVRSLDETVPPASATEIPATAQPTTFQYPYP